MDRLPFSLRYSWIYISLLLLLIALPMSLSAQEPDSEYHELMHFGRGPITDIRWHPSGEYLAVSTPSRIWLYTDTFEDMAELESPTGHVAAMAWSPDGNYLAGSADGYLWLWDLTTFEANILISDDAPTLITILDWKPDGTQIAVGDNRAIWLWDVLNGEVIANLETDATIQDIAWKPDGTQIAGSSWFGTVDIWDTETYELLEQWPHPQFDPEHPYWSSVNSLQWSPDGAYLAGGRSSDFGVDIWNAATSQLVVTLGGHTHGVSSVEWSPDGTHFASGSGDGILQIWDTSTWRTLQVINEPANIVWHLSWHPQGDLIAVAGSNVAYLLDTATGERLHSLEKHNWIIDALAWNPQSTQIGVASDNVITIWDIPSREPVAVLHDTSHALQLAWQPTGHLLASRPHGAQVTLWNTDTRQIEEVIEVTTTARDIAWSPDGSSLAIVDSNAGTSSAHSAAKILLWRANSQEVQTLLELPMVKITALSWSPDGESLAVAITTEDLSGQVIIVDIRTTQTTMVLEAERLEYPSRFVAWSPQGEYIAANQYSEHSFTTIWNTATGEIINTIDNGTSFAWHPDGHILAINMLDSVGNGDMVQILNLETGEIRVVVGHREPITALAWSPDGTMLATGSQDYTVRIWGQ